MRMAHERRAGADWDGPHSPLIRHALERTESVFGLLSAYSYISPVDRADFSYYRDSFLRSLRLIDGRIDRGELTPVDLRDFPLAVRWPGYRIDAALFIGSFDPFQMTHLAMALRYLASDAGSAPVVFVVPEGHFNPNKPLKSEYEYRYQLMSMQLDSVFRPLVVPLDLGKGADTIEIVRRFIALFPGSTLRLTHLLGSDVLPFAAKLLPEDLGIWYAEARKRGVDFNYRAFVASRVGAPPPGPHAELVRSMGIDIHVDTAPIGAPSSTDFREGHTFSIVFPTQEVISHMEVLFRYNLNNPWRVVPTRGPKA